MSTGSTRRSRCSSSITGLKTDWIDPINIVGLSEREKKVLELLRQDPTLTRAKMAGILGCSDATIKRALGSMVQKNVIRRIGANKKGEWIIIL